MNIADIPGIGAPAKRALEAAGYTTIDQLNGVDTASIAALHGVGPRVLERLQDALVKNGQSLGGKVPDKILHERQPATATKTTVAKAKAATSKAAKSKDSKTKVNTDVTITKGHTGKTAKDVKTKPTEVDPAEFIENLEWPRRIEHGRELLRIFNEVTGEEPVMWGPTMIGYGAVHYKSSSGREGDWFHIGFSPRKASLSIYGMQGHPRSEELLSKVGKHKLGIGCMYVNKLEDLDMDVFRELVTEAWDNQPD